MKHIYTFIGLLFTFILSLLFFSRNIPSISVTTTTATSLQDSTFPIVYLQTGKYEINTLHGYSSDLNSASFRESITPLDTKKTFSVKIDENESKIKRLSYELRDIANNTVIEEGNITALDHKKNYKMAKIKLKEAMDTSTEYGMKITLTTNSSKKIHFYTRLKYYENDFFLKEKLEFVSNFHNACFQTKSDFKITQYLEPTTNDDSSYANVDIHSSHKLITWGDLEPKILTEVVPTIKEINIETAAIIQDYYVSAKTDSGVEKFHVKEFYRVRYTQNRIYLLYFKRTMEAMFDPNLISYKKSEIKIGITNQNDFKITTSASNKKFAFVRNGSLWYYDLEKETLHQVFTFENNTKDYLRDCYDQHDIKILKISDEGTIIFVVYGYMNCGDYEGRVGILLYEYDPKKDCINERVYIPLETTFAQLEEDFGDYCYVNNKNIFYFSLNERIYSYNMSSKQYSILTKNASSDNFLMLKNANCFVWSDLDKNDQAKSITILNLDTNNELTVDAPKNQNIVVLGTIDNNIVYGFVKDKDIFEDTSGDTIRPAYQLIISDCQGNVLRMYQNKNRYVVDAKVEGNIIRLKRMKKVNGKWKKATDDSIMNQKNTTKASIDLTNRVMDLTLTEKYISLPAGYVMDKLPDIKSTKTVMVTENTTLHLSDNALSSVKYYVYAYGGITTSKKSIAEAIIIADEQMGVVMDNKNHIVWERGGKYFSKKIANISYPDNNINSKKSTAVMLLQAAQVTTSTSQLKGNSIMKMLKKHLDQPVNLTGCTVDEILYFVSNERPVIGMLNSNHAVLITGYTTSTVTWMDPLYRKSTTVSIQRAEKMFEDAGSIFISFVN